MKDPARAAAAWKFVNYMAGKPYRTAKRWAVEKGLGFGQLPLFDDPDVVAAWNKWIDMDTLNQQVAKAKAGTWTEWTAAWSAYFRPLLAKAMVGEATRRRSDEGRRAALERTAREDDERLGASSLALGRPPTAAPLILSRIFVSHVDASALSRPLARARAAARRGAQRLPDRACAVDQPAPGDAPLSRRGLGRARQLQSGDHRRLFRRGAQELAALHRHLGAAGRRARHGDGALSAPRILRRAWRSARSCSCPGCCPARSARCSGCGSSIRAGACSTASFGTSASSTARSPG